MTDIPGLIERLRLYEAIWGDEPSIPPHPRTSPGFTTGRVIGDAKEAADALSRLSEDKKRLEEALERVMIGGNHIVHLIGIPHPPSTATHEEASTHYASHLGSYDAWCCWKTIMDARSALKGEGT
jgi:hypothetical protein